MRLPLALISPVTCNAAVGFVVPIPTFPADAIYIRVPGELLLSVMKCNPPSFASSYSNAILASALPTLKSRLANVPSEEL